MLRACAADTRVAAVVANSPILDLRAYLTSFVGVHPEQAMAPEDDVGLTDIDGIPDLDLGVQPREPTSRGSHVQLLKVGGSGDLPMPSARSSAG